MRILKVLLLSAGFSFAAKADFIGTWKKYDSLMIKLGVPLKEEINFGANDDYEERLRMETPGILITQGFYPWQIKGDSIIIGMQQKGIAIQDSGTPDQEINYSGLALVRAYKFSFPDPGTLILSEKMCKCDFIYKRIGTSKQFTIADIYSKFPNGVIQRAVRTGERKPAVKIGAYPFKGSEFKADGRDASLGF